MLVGIDRFVARFPGDIGERAFRDHPQILFARQRKKQFERLLIGDVNRSLQDIERAGFHRKLGRAAVTAIAEVTRVTARARRLQRGDDVAFSQGGFGAAMQLD